MTSNPTKDGVLIEKDDFEDGRLPYKSWVKPKRIFTVNKKIVRKKLCKMKGEFHEKIIDEINKYFRRD